MRLEEFTIYFYAIWAIGRAIIFLLEYEGGSHWMMVVGLSVLHGLIWPISYLLVAINKFEDWIDL